MYINRKGIVNNHGIKATIKDMVFDIESIILVAGKDTRDIFYDIYEDMIDIRWDLFVYKMQKRGLLDSDVKVSRAAAIASSFIGLIFFR